jgi:spore coat polysaccharide biosynthesis protein SpsF (cytidylyltransferase family)
MGSTRYPGKTLEPILDVPLVVWALTFANKIRGIDRVVLASPDTEGDRVLKRYAETVGVDFFSGPEENVLDRFVLAADRVGVDHLVRICGDNPLLDHLFMGRMVEAHLLENADYTRTFSPVPLGTVGEVVACSALKRSAEKARESRYRMHVTTYILDHPDEFRIHRMEAPDYLRGLPYRFTVDTPEDMNFFREIAGKLRDRGLEFNLGNALALLRKNPDLARINASIPQHDWRRD